MLQPKLPIHLNNQYPMSRSPPVFDSSSPGPDPYHSLQSLHNVYEELHPTHDSDADSEFHPHSDDDFAEDELSLAGETTAVLMATSTSTSGSTTNHPEAGSSQTTAMIPTIFNESNMNYRRMGANTDATSVSAMVERDSVMSLVSAANDRNGAGDSSCSSRSSSGATRITRGGNIEHTVAGPFARNHSKTLNNRDINSPDRTGLAQHYNQYHHNHVNMNNGNGGTSSKRLNNSNRINNNNTIGGQHHPHHGHHPHHSHTTSANNNLRSKSRDNICSNGSSAACTECRVERQNLMNRQMSSTMHKKRGGGGGGGNHGQQMEHHHPSGISTIFHERAMNGNGGSHYAFPETTGNAATNACPPPWTNGNQRMRTMPYASANCQPRAMANNHHDPAYDYAQPVFHEGLLYDTGFTSDVARLQPEYTSLGSSASGVSSGNHPHAIYSRDSSFGSDSGYSRGESGGSASGNVLGLGLGRLKKHTSNSKTMGKSVL